MTILLMYYCNDVSLIKEILSFIKEFKINNSDIYEVLSGYETNTASSFIESTFVEAGIGIPIIHDKYNFVHGRSTLGFNYSNNLIFFDCDNELDSLYRNILDDYYNNIIRIEKLSDDNIINDYYFTYISMLLCKSIACQKDKDLSNVDYSPLVKKLYYFKGEM